MSIVNQIMNNIREELGNPEPSYKRIITLLSDLRIKEEYQSLSDSEFYDIVGETFKLNPEFFMNHIYPEMRGGKLSKKINKMDMDKYIIEKFCLYEGEQILYECNGKIKEIISHEKTTRKPVKISIDGRIYVTNYRVIAHGIFSVKGGGGVQFDWGRRAQRVKGKGEFVGRSTSQELPCYGFQFKTKDMVGLKKKIDGIQYAVMVRDVENISITSSKMKQAKAWAQVIRRVRITLTDPNEEQIGHLFELLCRDINQVLNTFREIHEGGLPQEIKQLEFLEKLQPFHYFPYKGKILSKLQGDDIHQFSDSDYFEIVKEAYRLDPEFFMTSIYPEMMSWKHWEKFLSTKDLKEEIISLINKLNKVLSKEISPLKIKAKEVIPPLEKKIIEPPSLTIEKEQKIPIEKIDEQPIIKDSTISDEHIIPEEKEISEVKINACQFCGMEINEDINFCSHCGMKIKKD